MNEKLQYAQMLGVPDCTCNITYKPAKKRRKKAKKEVIEDPKQELIDRINNSDEKASESIDNELVKANDLEQENDDTVYIHGLKKDKKTKMGKFGVLRVQVALIGVLIATILLTNTLLPNSGINRFFASVFSPESQIQSTDSRFYSQFSPSLPVSNIGGISLENGVMNLYKESSIYSPCDGSITAINQAENGTVNLEITHSDNFKTVFTGVSYVYGEIGSTVYSNIPVGYIELDGAKMCFYNGEGEIITNYTLDDNSVIWAV